MKQIIRLTESDLHNIVREAVNRILAEDGEIGGGGATNCVGINVGGAAGQAKNHIDAPAFGGKNKKKVGGNAFSEPIMRQAHNLGDVTDAPTNQVDMKPALKRGGSIAMGENFERKINEAVEEGIGNWIKGAALGGMMAMSSPQAAQAQNYQQQDNTQQTMQTKQNKPVHQRGTYWDLADNAVGVQKVTKQDIAPIMNNIRAVTANLTDWLQTIERALTKVSPEQKRETENAILTHCVKNQRTGKLVNTNSFTLDDASYVKRVYDTGDNLVSININGTNYFVSVAALNEAMQIMGMQKGGDNLIKAFKYHK
jgi:hypothetical protein